MPSLHSPFPSLQLDASSRSLLQSLPPENPKPKPQEWVQTPEAYPLLLYPNGTIPYCPGASGGCSHSLFQGTSPRLFAHLLPTHHVLIPASLIPFISFAHSQPRFFFFHKLPKHTHLSYTPPWPFFSYFFLLGPLATHKTPRPTSHPTIPPSYNMFTLLNWTLGCFMRGKCSRQVFRVNAAQLSRNLPIPAHEQHQVWWAINIFME